MKSVRISDTITCGPTQPLLLIAGPCQIQSLDHCLKIGEHVKKIADRLSLNFIFKSSFDKANRTSLSGQRGVGPDQGLKILAEVKKQLGVPVLTDVHSADQAQITADVVDVLQTPAFLCRQTDFLIAVGKTGKPVNVKKGQFLAPEDMAFVAEKIASTGNTNILLCERGTCFGYRDLVLDPRSLVIMQETGYPVIFDATHTVQSMGGGGGKSGGQRQYVAPLAKAAVAIGVDGIFIECHEAPDSAPSDGPSMLPLQELDALLVRLNNIRMASVLTPAQSPKDKF